MNLLTAQAPARVPRSGKGLALGIGRMIMVALVVMLSLGFTQVAVAQADPDREMSTAAPGITAEQWRQVRGGETDANFRDSRHESTYNLINASGETWRTLRNRWVSPFGLIAIVGMAAVITLFYFVVGRKHLDEPRTGRKLFRWSLLLPVKPPAFLNHTQSCFLGMLSFNRLNSSTISRMPKIGPR